jgi:tetratricopeptide (TPR) repeat protein
MVRKIGVKSDIAWRLFELGEIHRIFGKLENALKFYDQAYVEIEKMKMIQALGFYQRAQGDITLQESRHSDALNHYREFMSYATQDNHHWGIAQAHGRLALAQAYLGNLEESRLEYKETLSEIRDWGEIDLTLLILLAEPVCLIQEGNHEMAVELAAFIAHHPVSWNETKQHAIQILETASCSLSDEITREAAERGKALDLDSIIASLTKDDIQV